MEHSLDSDITHKALWNVVLSGTQYGMLTGMVPWAIRWAIRENTLSLLYLLEEIDGKGGCEDTPIANDAS